MVDELHPDEQDNIKGLVRSIYSEFDTIEKLIASVESHLDEALAERESFGRKKEEIEQWLRKMEQTLPPNEPLPLQPTQSEDLMKSNQVCSSYICHATCQNLVLFKVLYL